MAQINHNYTTKSGEVKTYNYFYADYKLKHKCTICDCIYTKNTKFNHVKTEYHKLAEKLRNENPNITNESKLSSKVLKVLDNNNKDCNFKEIKSKSFRTTSFNFNSNIFNLH
jgi:hypothetical protein